MYRSPRRLHLTREGQVCLPGDPKSASLLVAEGGELSDEDARKYGLIGGGPAGGPAGAEDVLPLNSSPAPAPSGSPAPITSTPDPSATEVIRKASEGFPQQINLGATPAPTSPQTPAPTEQTAPTQPPVANTTDQPPANQPQQPPPPAPTSDLPDDFPFKSILVNQNFGTKEQVKSATKEQLIGLDQIGSARADEIIAAIQKLG